MTIEGICHNLAVVYCMVLVTLRATGNRGDT